MAHGNACCCPVALQRNTTHRSTYGLLAVCMRACTVAASCVTRASTPAHASTPISCKHTESQRTLLLPLCRVLLAPDREVVERVLALVQL